MRTRDLLKLRNTGHPGINALFAKAHSADWDYERDLDWSIPIDPEDPLVDEGWTAFGATPTFATLPEHARRYATRRALGRMLNILQVGESVAQNVCAKLVLALPEEDYRNHAAAQAMDEARHHLGYRRFLDKMDEEVEDIDLGSEMLFDALLAMDDPVELIATEQFFLESMAMNIFEGIHEHATHPLLRDLLALITRDESRHMGFGILFVAEWMRAASPDARVRFSRRWLGQMLGTLIDRPGPIMLSRLVKRLREAGVADADAYAPRLLAEQQERNEAEIAAIVSGEKVPHLLKSARRAGLLDPDVLAAVGLVDHPLLRGVLRAPAEPEPASS